MIGTDTSRHSGLCYCGLGIAIMAMAAVVCGGCGGGDSEKPADPAPRRLVQQPPQIDPGPAAVRPQAVPGAATPTPPGPPAQPGFPQVNPPGVKPPEQEPKVPRPDDVSKWEKSDYLNAKRENDPRLLQAVRYLGENFVGKPSIAQGLADLLRAEEPKPPGQKPTQPGFQPGMEPGMQPEVQPGMPSAPRLGAPAQIKPSTQPGLQLGAPSKVQPQVRPGMEPGIYPGMEAEFGPGGHRLGGHRLGGHRLGGHRQGRPGRVSSELIQVIVWALANNDTDKARKILLEVVAGTFKTDDDQTAVTAVLREFVQRPCPKNEEFLFVALTTPEKVRKSAGGSTSTPGLTPGRPGFQPGGLSRRPGQTEMTPEWLRKTVLQWIEPTASGPFREKLAKYLLDPNTPQGNIHQLRGIIEKPRPENVGAQILLYKSDAPGNQTKAQLEQYFAQYSSEALGHVLRILVDKKSSPPASGGENNRWGQPPPPAQPRTRPRSGWPEQPGGGSGWEDRPLGTGPAGASPAGASPIRLGPTVPGPGMVSPTIPNPYGRNLPRATSTDPDLPYRVAKKLWAPEFTKIVAKRLGQIESLKSPGQVFSLARTMPADNVRAALHRLLQKHWKDGPGVLGLGAASGRGSMIGGIGLRRDFGAGGFGPGNTSSQAINDPGLLILVKLLPRKDSSTTTPGGTRHGPRSHPLGGINPEIGGGPGGGPGGGQAQASPRQWMQASETLLRGLCAQFQAAAKNRGGGPAGTLPVEPHSGANVVARYDLVLPRGAPKKLSGLRLDPIEIHYIRIEESANPHKLLSYYRRKTKSKGRAIDNDRGMWLDSIEKDATTGRRTSRDVLIMTTGANPARGIPQPGPGGRADRSKKKTEDVVVEILTIEMRDPGPVRAR